MKKLLLLACLILCSCRTLPADTYTFKTTQKNNNYRYVIDSKYLSIFDEEIQRSLRTTGTPIATVKISDQRISRGSVDNVLWLTPSILTLGIINLVGWPAYHESTSVRVKAEVYDNAGNLVDSYSSIGSDWSIAACYYGYDPGDAEKKAYNGAYKEALEQVLSDIYNDKELPKILKGIADKEIAERRKREAELKAEQEKIKAQKQKHLNNVMSDLENL